MKAAMNGVLNLSILDGWWPEGCEHGVNGWAIGDANSGMPEQDARDAGGAVRRARARGAARRTATASAGSG